jgi:hypothetical protein
MRLLATAAALVAATPLGAPEVVRQARPADAVQRAGAPTEWWELAAIDPRTREGVRVRFARSEEIPALGVNVSALGFHESIGQDVVAPDGAVVRSEGIQGTAMLARNGRRWRLTMTGRVAGTLTLTRALRGATALRWRLGQSLRWPRWERVGLNWSMPVATSRVDGTLTAEGQTVRIDGWRASLEHVWGDFRFIDDAWGLGNAFTIHRRGGAALAFGLNRADTATGPGARDAQWLGVVATVGRRRARVCRPTVHRRGWVPGTLAGREPFARVLQARCGRRTITFRQIGDPELWGGDSIGFFQYAGVATATGGGFGIATPFGRIH